MFIISLFLNKDIYINMICENCGKEHDGSYGSGRFCSRSCQTSFFNKRRGGQSSETRLKISNALKGRKKTKVCKVCGNEFIPNGKEVICSEKCKSVIQYIKSLIKYFGFDDSKLGTSDVFNEIDKVRTKLYNDYWIYGLSGKNIADKYKYPNVSNITGKIFRYLNIPRRPFKDAVKLGILEGRLVNAETNNQYKCCWHTTWNNKEVYLRSSYELDYANILDEQKIDYKVEYLRIKYFDTNLNEYRCAIPDFYLPKENVIVEIKSNYTLDIQNMKDKFIEYKKLGYIPKLILEHIEVDIFNL